MRTLRETIRQIILQESNRAQDWRRVEKILTQVLQGVQSAFPEKLPVDPVSMPDLHAKGRKFYRLVQIERGTKAQYGRTNLDADIFVLNNKNLDPVTQEIPAISISKGFFNPLQEKGTTILEITSDLPRPTRQRYELEMQDIINDQGQALYELLVKLVGEMV